MRKYLEVFRITIAEYFVYRLNFLLWRLRVVLNLFLIYFFWFSIFEGKQVLFGYTKAEMLTYILLSSLISNFVLGTRTVDLAGTIIEGNIINLLLKPISIFKYYFTRDLSDKFLNILFAFFEIAIIIIIFKPDIFVQKNLFILLNFFVFFVIGTIISFFTSMSLSLIGFWTTEVWAPRFIYFILIFFLSGSYFPLDILPKPIYTLLLLTPFPYLYYLPTKIFVKGLSPDITLAIIISGIWIILSYILTKFLWQKGLKNYSFYGR